MSSSFRTTMRTSFRSRALVEAARYGSDSWVFLRELLQNARDAGSRHVEVTVTADDESETIAFRDDGSGMSYRHARRYLFALYASSKEEDQRQAGQFGVGFWSVLRFGPRSVTIRSRPQGKTEGWQVEVAGDLAGTRLSAVDMNEGTEIVLERPARRTRSAPPEPPEVVAKVEQALKRYGRFITQKGSRRPLEVRLNGQLINTDMTLPPPSATFGRNGFRGVVALGQEPRVELFANGLFVRQASCLEDLLDTSRSGQRSGRESLTLPGSLAPQVILDSSELEILLARSDVRETRQLERLVRTAEQELARLVERQLQALRPQPWYLPLWGRLREAWGRLSPAWAAAAVLAGVLVGWTAFAWQGTEASAGLPQLRMGAPSWEAYSDLASRYRGPRLDALTTSESRIGLRYEPAEAVLFWRALQVDEPSRWAPAAPQATREEYRGIKCQDGCVAVSLLVAGGNDVLRLPLPTGHQLDPSTVLFNKQPQEVFTTAVGEPLLVLGQHGGGVVEYRTGWAPALIRPLPRLRDVPWEIERTAAGLRQLPVRDRARRALAWVSNRVRYDRALPAVELHRQAREAGDGFLETALASGKGDCDIQNGVLLALLRQSRVHARLAVGWVGAEGRLIPGLHAWVEYVDAGNWRVADASARFSEDGLPLALSRTWNEPRTTSAEVDLPGGVAARREAGPEPEVAARAVVPADAFETGRAWGWPLLTAGGVLLLFALVLFQRQRRTVGSVRVAAEGNLAALLGGALEHAELARLPVLRYGRFVPLVGRRAISLHTARRLAADGNLYSSAKASELARKAAGRRLAVVDTSCSEGQVVALGLGAVDLDEWSALLERSRSSVLTDRLNRELAKLGEPWSVAAVPGLGQRLRAIDLQVLGAGSRVVLIDPDASGFVAVRRHLDDRPAAAMLEILDAVVAEIDLPARRRARLLRAFAGAALREAALREVGLREVEDL